MYKQFGWSSSFLLLLFFYATKSVSQTTYSLNSHIWTQGSTQEHLPFWLHSNRKGRIHRTTSAAGLLAGKVQHTLPSGAIVEIAAGGAFRNHGVPEFFVDKAYIEFRNDFVRLTGGIKHERQVWNGLSATNENILWSLNARALPGLEIATSNTIPILPGVGFEALWAEYILEHERHVPRARVHRKRFHLVLQPTEKWRIKVGIQHFAQWGGISPDKGKQPHGITDYLRIITGRQGGEDALQGDKENSLGNHLGSWEVEVQRTFGQNAITFIYNNIFEDGSGSRLANFPDGRYGFFWNLEESYSLFNSILYEFYYTKHQSHDVNRWGADNYLDHHMTYNSGWTYFGQVIGAPFFLYDEAGDDIINNKFTAHHIGWGGNFGTFYNPYPYKVLLSYRHNEGTYTDDSFPPDREPKIFSTYLETRIFNAYFEDYTPELRLNLVVGADFHNFLDPNFAAGLALSYKIL